MSHRGTVRSLIESHRANATRPDRRILLPQTGQLLPLPVFARRIQTAHLPAGSSRPARAADAARAANTGEIKNLRLKQISKNKPKSYEYKSQPFRCNSKDE